MWLLLSGCGPHWTTAEPIEPWIPSLSFPSRQRIWQNAADALAQVGFRVEPFSDQKIYFEVEEHCEGDRVGKASPFAPIVYLCRTVVEQGPTLMWTVKHEVGHVLGAGHTPDADGGIMVRDMEFWRLGGKYDAADLEEIRRSGRID